VVDEDLTFPERPPGALAVLVPELPGRPLHVTAEGPAVTRVTTVDVDGLAEWRSVNGELRVVHQVELTPAPAVRFRWTVTPKLRVVSTAAHHWYHQCLYASLADRVDVRPVPYHLLDDPARLTAALAGVDVFHLHWPEWLTGPSARRAARVATPWPPPGSPWCGPSTTSPPRRPRRQRAVPAVGGTGRRRDPPQRVGPPGHHRALRVRTRRPPRGHSPTGTGAR
jgi:hypothetical protein